MYSCLFNSKLYYYFTHIITMRGYRIYLIYFKTKLHSNNINLAFDVKSTFQRNLYKA